MVAIQANTEAIECTIDGHSHIVKYNPDDIETSISALVSLAERKVFTWDTIAALRVAMINKQYPYVLKTKKPKVKRQAGIGTGH
jgi:hypothetical protein